MINPDVNRLGVRRKKNAERPSIIRRQMRHVLNAGSVSPKKPVRRRPALTPEQEDELEVFLLITI